jgi:hypothetical protein
VLAPWFAEPPALGASQLGYYVKIVDAEMMVAERGEG